MRRIHTRFLAALFAVGAAMSVSSACASGGSEPTGGSQAIPQGDRLAIEIRNTLGVQTTVTVKLRAPGRPVKILGNVGPNDRQTFVVGTSDIAAGFVLIAERDMAAQLVSDPIDTLCCAKITWNLGANLINVERL